MVCPYLREGGRRGTVTDHGTVEAKYVFDGMMFISIEYKGVKRDFKVLKITLSPQSSSHKQDDTVSKSASVTGIKIISAYRATNSTSVSISSTTSSVVSKRLIPRPCAVTPEKALPPSLPTLQSSSNGTYPLVPPATPLPTFTQIGGLSLQLTKLKSLIISALHHAHHFSALNLTPFRGILLYGPPGTGKSLIMRCLPGTLSLHLPHQLSTYNISGSVVGKYLGESEASIRKIFKEAKANQPSIIFIDEVDSLAPKRGGIGSGDDSSDGRIVMTLMTELDDLGDGGTVVVAATNRPNGIDEGLRRPGRLDRELEIPRPDIKAREEILTLMLSKVRKGWLLPPETVPEESPTPSPISRTPPTTASDTIIKSFSSRTHGFVGADLEALVRGGVLLALSRLTVGSQLLAESQPTVHESDLEASLKDVRPTAMREIFFETPNVRWSDIGGQSELKQRLREAVEWPLTHPEVFIRLGGTPRKGLLLYGPPGCSKTLTAKALATEAGLNFMPVKGPELLNMYVGESERAVREVFRKARNASPAIIFFDEIDALAAARKGSASNSSIGASSGVGGVNVLTALLNEMDGIETLRGVIILAATNRPELLDPALMRPGRLDTILYVGPPDLHDRLEILRIKTGKMAILSDVLLDQLALDTEGYSGAEIVHICDEAAHYAMRESMDIEAVAWRHFQAALDAQVRQISLEMRRFYEDWSVGGVRRL